MSVDGVNAGAGANEVQPETKTEGDKVGGDKFRQKMTRKVERQKQAKRKGDQKAEAEGEGAKAEAEGQAVKSDMASHGSRLAEQLQQGFGQEQVRGEQAMAEGTAELATKSEQSSEQATFSRAKDTDAKAELDASERSPAADVLRRAQGKESAGDKAQQDVAADALKERQAQGHGDRDEVKETLQDQLSDNLFNAGITNQNVETRLQELAEVGPVETVQPQIPPEIIDRVVDRVRYGMNAEGAHEFQIDLKQDVLQGAELKVVSQDGKVTVQVISDDPQVQASLQPKLAALKAALKKKGIDDPDISVLSQAQAYGR